MGIFVNEWTSSNSVISTQNNKGRGEERREDEKES